MVNIQLALHKTNIKYKQIILKRREQEKERPGKGREGKQDKEERKIQASLTLSSLQDQLANWRVMDLPVVKSLIGPQIRPVALCNYLGRGCTSPSSLRHRSAPCRVRGKCGSVHTRKEEDLSQPPRDSGTAYGLPRTV